MKTSACETPCSECPEYQNLLRDNDRLQTTLTKIRDEAELHGELGRDDIINLTNHPPRLKIERLRLALRSLLENIGGHQHWDPKGTHGANCPICERQVRATEQAMTVLREEM